MFIWGEKVVYKRLGYVADFCPLCRELRAFELLRVGIAGHIYYISLVEGKLQGYRLRCQVCRTEYETDPHRFAKLEKNLLAPPQLAASTFPQWHKEWAERLAVEKALADPFAHVSPQWRAALLREPFRLLAPRVETRFESFHVDRDTAVTIIVALLLVLGVAKWMGQSSIENRDEVLALTAALGLAAVVVQALLARGRYFRRVIFPILAPTLRPLKPRREELEAVIAELEALKLKIARKIRLDALMAALAKPRA